MKATLRSGVYRQLAGFFIVLLTMVEMFTIPRNDFVLGSIVSTSAMICVAYLLLGEKKKILRPSAKLLILSVVAAVLLYLVFVLGNLAVRVFSPFGMSATSEQGIYNLFKNVSVPLLLLVLVLDALGFEAYFRGNLLNILSQKIGANSVIAIAGLDALIHLVTLNPLFSATTFVADLSWGFYFYKTRDLSSTIAFHFIWDLMIFVLIPIN